ncbi:MAG: pentapeptide repeat-containing protein [Saprospiraceae bacterium]|nr:pentapeptide repeat-containing protein [Saprospiraceae bacterium]MBK7811119.1 pentapeptide repeat-containing protein [Saprospiraceae bacterium]MBK9630717.1 pentapeptide repeat-containing protein [Saprospiraceae bacterium]
MLHSKSIGHKIASARKKVNLSQAELAQQVYISAQAVGKWERGESMPDITTLNRLAEILGVDLNYFSDNFESIDHEEYISNTESLDQASIQSSAEKKNPSWDMSKLNLVDSDFSGLKNLHEKFSSSNMQRCLFIGSNMSGLVLSNNNVDACDFSDSDISNSQIQTSNLDNNIFKNCSLKETKFFKNNIGNCDFSGADFTNTQFKYCAFLNNNVSNAKWSGTKFMEMGIQEIVFEGIFEDCFFENCAFYDVKFQNATLINTFFKNNQKFKRVKFIDCKVDKITYAFLKSNLANLEGVTVIS